MNDRPATKRKARAPLTPREAIANWIYYLEVRFSFGDRVNQETYVRKFFTWYIRHKPRLNWLNISHADILEFLKFRQKQRVYRENTLLTEIRALKNFFKFLLEEGAIDKSPMDGDIPLAWTRKSEPRFPLTEEEVGKLRETITAPVRRQDSGYDDIPAGNAFHRAFRAHLYFPYPHQRVARDWAIFELLQETGIRLNELMQIQLTDIDFDRRTITIQHGKGRKERKVFFGRNALLALQAYLPNLIKREAHGRFKYKLRPVRTDTRIFCGITRDQLRVSLKTYAKLAGIKKNVYPHIFRHTFITKMHARTGNLNVIQKLVGHSAITTTSRYIHPSEALIEQVYREAFEE